MEAIADKAVFLKNGHLVDQVDLEEMRREKGISMADRYREIYGHEEAQA
jgi:ABC-2 type transport system ATP-binding protein